MAPLNVGAAEAARLDARRLRHEAEALRLAVRGSLACSRERLGRAHVEAGKARARRVEPLPSPWSDLRWMQSYETLDLTLVSLPSA